MRPPSSFSFGRESPIISEGKSGSFGVDVATAVKKQTESLEANVRQLRTDLSNPKRLMELGGAEAVVVASRLGEDVDAANESAKRLSRETEGLKECLDRVRS